MPILSRPSSIRMPILLLACIEIAVLFSAIYVAGWIVFGSLAESARILHPIELKATAIATVVLLCFIAMGLYGFHQRLYFREAVLRVLVGLGCGCLGLAVIYYAIPVVMVRPEIASIAVAYALLLLLGVRYVFVRRVDYNIFRRKTLVFGAGERASAIDDLRRRADRRGFKVVGQVEAPGDVVTPNKDVLRTNGKSITQYAIERGAEEIVVAMDDRRGNLPIRDLLDARLRGIDVIDLLEFLERESGKIRVDLVNPGWLIFSPGFKSSPLRRFNKRVVDVVASLSILLVAWPVMFLIALAIKLEDGFSAPIFYKQARVGLGQKPFSVLKFRSMRTDAEADGKAVWASKGDNRVTRVGGFLRLSRLDELPQVVNVLRGDMSLVGPRPERPAFVEKLTDSIPYYAERHTVKPGLTGWAQLRYAYGASEEDALEKLQFELYYIKNQSLMLDLLIILQTVEVVLWGKGAR